MARGTLRIYLGAAPGVGKTFAMLNEGRRRRERGDGRRRRLRRDARPAEAPPSRSATSRSSRAGTSSTAARRSRRWTSTPSSRAGPQVALVDELAHTNVPGSRNEKRWQDVEELLDAGIDVISTVNIQHLESLNDVVEQITGVKQRETIPDEVVRRADQIELVDMTPEALRRRMAHGNIYPPERVDAALAQLLPAGQPRRAARARAAVGRRPGRRGARRSTASATASTGRGRRASACSSRLTGAPGRRAPRSAARRGWRTRTQRRADRRARQRRRTGSRPRRRGAARPSSAALEELGGEYHEVVGEDIGAALARLRPRRRTRRRSCSARAGGRAGSELTRGSVDQPGDPRTRGGIDVHVISHREATTRTSVRRCRARRRPARSRRAGRSLGLAARGVLGLAAPHARARRTCATTLGLPSVLLLFLLARRRAWPRSAASGPRSRPPSPASCSSTGSSLPAPHVHDRPRPRTCSRSSSSSRSPRS